MLKLKAKKERKENEYYLEFNYLKDDDIEITFAFCNVKLPTLQKIVQVNFDEDIILTGGKGYDMILELTIDQRKCSIFAEPSGGNYCSKVIFPRYLLVNLLCEKIEALQDLSL